MISYQAYFVGFILFLFAGFGSGIIGFGVNIICIPILSIFVEPKIAIAMVSLPSMVNNFLIIYQWRDSSTRTLIKRIYPIIISGSIGMCIGTILLVNLNSTYIQLGLGFLTLLYVFTNNLRKNFHINPKHEYFSNPPVGFVAGFIGGISGISGPLLVAYFHSLKFEKRSFVYALSTIFFTFSIVQSVNLFVAKLYTVQIVLICLSYIIPLAIGTKLGESFQASVSQELFNRVLLSTLFLTGLDIIRRALHLF